MMGVVSSRSSSISLSQASSLTGLEEQLEAMALKEAELGGEEMSDKRQADSAKRQEGADNLLRKSSSHLLVTANSSADHLHFIRCFTNFLKREVSCVIHFSDVSIHLNQSRGVPEGTSGTSWNVPGVGL